MRIAAVQHVIPSRVMTNDDVLAAIRGANAHLDEPALVALERDVTTFLTAAGTEIRYVLDEGERAIDLVAAAARRALTAADLSPGAIDLVIYAGVARGWLEPSTASVLQGVLGISHASAFEVLDACAGWLRALQVAHGFLHSGTYRNVLILNGECGLYRRYGHYVIEGEGALAHQLAGYTIGEAATATVVTADDSTSEYYFDFQTFPESGMICVLPSSAAEDFWPGPMDERVHTGRFFAISQRLLDNCARKIISTYEANPRLRGQRPTICFGHSAGEKVAQLIGRRLGLSDVFFGTHRAYGNTVSASIPLAMSLAQEQGRLKRGDDVLVIVGSAGITVAFATFKY